AGRDSATGRAAANVAACRTADSAAGSATGRTVDGTGPDHGGAPPAAAARRAARRAAAGGHARAPGPCRSLRARPPAADRRPAARGRRGRARHPGASRDTGRQGRRVRAGEAGGREAAPGGQAQRLRRRRGRAAEASAVLGAGGGREEARRAAGGGEGTARPGVLSAHVAGTPKPGCSWPALMRDFLGCHYNYMINHGNIATTSGESPRVTPSSAGPATSSNGVSGSENTERTGTSEPADLLPAPRPAASGLRSH